MTVDQSKYRNVKEGYLHWREYLNAFGLGVKLGVDLPGENGGNIPDTAVYNLENDNRWTSCTNLTLGIGQDKMLTTPLQMANAMAVICNKGYYYTPHFVKGIEGEGDDDEALLNRFQQKHDVLTNIPDIVFNEVIEGMSDVVKVGTARGAQIEGVEVCAKTGTAENYTKIDGKRVQLTDHSIFVAFAPKENPEIAIAVIIENGTPNITTAVCNAPRPPAAKSTAATTPKSIAHVTLERSGESPSISAPFFADSIEATNAPESEDVTKKVTIRISDAIDKPIEKDIDSYNTKRAVLALSLTAPEISPMLLRT